MAFYGGGSQVMNYIGYMIVGIAVVGVLAVLLWILIVVRSGGSSMFRRKPGPPRSGERPAHGPVSGGTMRAGPAQVTPTRGAEDDDVSGEDVDVTRRDRESD
jgi:hypothetical protein